MVPGTRRDELHGLEIVGVDYRDAALLYISCIIADPEITLVSLKLDAHRVLAGFDLVRHFERLGIDERQLGGKRHGHEQALVVFAEHPVGAGPAEVDLREQVRDAGDADHRVDHRNGRVAIEHQQEMAVEVDHRPHADNALQVGYDAILAGHGATALGLPGFAEIHPGGGITAPDGLTRARVSDAKRDVGPVAGVQRSGLVRAHRPHREFNIDAFAGNEIARVRLSRSSVGGARVAVRAAAGSTQSEQHGSHPPQMKCSGLLSHGDPPLSLRIRHYVVIRGPCKRKVERPVRTAPRFQSSTSLSIIHWPA